MLESHDMYARIYARMMIDLYTDCWGYAGPPAEDRPPDGPGPHAGQDRARFPGCLC